MDSCNGLNTFKADELLARVLVPGVASLEGGESSQSLESRVLESALHSACYTHFFFIQKGHIYFIVCIYSCIVSCCNINTLFLCILLSL